MAYRWSWSWGSESIVVLADMGFAFSSSYFAPTSAQQYKPVGAPTKYSMATDYDEQLHLPNAVVAGMDQGVVSVAFKSASVNYSPWYSIITVESSGGTGNYIRVTSAGALNLYVDGSYASTSAVAYDFMSWRFVSLHFDFRVNPWVFKITVDGVASTGPDTASLAADTVGTVYTGSPNTTDEHWFNGQIIVQDEYADVASPRYVTRISPDADTSETGTWTPTTAGSNFASTGVDPFDAATYTEEGTPSAGDDVITSYASDLTTLLGGVPASVELVTVHSYSTGAANTARAEVGDAGGATTTVGTTTLIGSDTTYAYASAPVAPGDSAAWDGADIPKCKYEVVSV